MQSSVGLGWLDMVFRGGGTLDGLDAGGMQGESGKTGVQLVGVGEGGVGGHESTSAVETWWARSWSSCSSSGVENGRSKRLLEVGVLFSGVEESEFSSWLDQNLNQVEFEEFLWQMVVNYNDGSCLDVSYIDLLLRLIRVGSSVASVS